MVNITEKKETLRKAIATAVLRASIPETIEAVQNRTVPKGDVFEFGRAAGLLGIKKDKRCNSRLSSATRGIRGDHL